MRGKTGWVTAGFVSLWVLTLSAGVYDATLYSQVPLVDISDANRERYLADVRAAGVDTVLVSFIDFFEEGNARKPLLDKLARTIRFFETNGVPAAVWINGFGYGDVRKGAAGRRLAHSTFLTGLDGRWCGAACPLDPVIRQVLRENVRDVARAGARFILMDDDYVQSARGRLGCSCSNHLARVAAKCGRKAVTPEDVRRAFTGKPNPLRTAYLDVNGEVAVELARELRWEVDAVNPAIGMGLCASYTHWDVEGCDFPALVSAFAGGTRPFLRISGAPYWRNAKMPGTGLAEIIEFVRMQSAWVRGHDWTALDENDPYPRRVAEVPAWRCELYDKAIIADGRLARHKYMLCYGPKRTEPGYLEAHLANRPDDAKLRAIFMGTTPYGVKVTYPQHRLREAELPIPFAGEDLLTALYSQPTGAFALRRKGIPTRFDGPDATDEPLAVTIRAGSPDIYQIVHCDREKGEYAVLLENMGNAAMDVTIVTASPATPIATLRGDFAVAPDGLTCKRLPAHGYAAVRFALRR